MFDSMILDILFEHRESIQIGDYQYLLECVRKRQSNPIDAEIDFCNQQMELGEDDYYDYLKFLFPVGFLVRKKNSAMKVLLEIRDNAYSETIRHRLPPLKIYVLYHIYHESAELFNSFERDYLLPEKLEKTIDKLPISDDDRDTITEWFLNLYSLADDIEYYDRNSEFYLDESWISDAAYALVNDDESFLYRWGISVNEIAELIDLLPNDQYETVIKKLNVDNKMKMYDFFISYASEDRKPFVEDLVSCLKEQDQFVWFDQDQIMVGDSLIEHLNDGLKVAKRVIAVISPNYLRKYWPMLELESILTQGMYEENRYKLLPVYYGLTHKDITEQYPAVARLIGLDATKSSIEDICDAVIRQKAAR